MEQEIDMLLQNGQLWGLLNKRHAHDVLSAYEITFGGVQELAMEYDLLATIMLKLISADTGEKRLFWDCLNRKNDSHTDMAKRTRLWTKIKKRLRE